MSTSPAAFRLFGIVFVNRSDPSLNWCFGIIILKAISEAWTLGLIWSLHCSLPPFGCFLFKCDFKHIEKVYKIFKNVYTTFFVSSSHFDLHLINTGQWNPSLNLLHLLPLPPQKSMLFLALLILMYSFILYYMIL